MMNEKSNQRLNREKILDVARRHFTRFGYRKASLTDIAQDLGVVKGALYYHVPGGKRELLEAVMAREDERLIAAMIEAANSEPDPRRALVAAMEAKLQTLAGLRDLLGVRREVGEELAGLLRENERDFTHRERALVEGILARGEAQGAFRAIHPRSAAVNAIQAMINALEVGDLYRDEVHAGAPRLLDGVYDLILLGLEVRS